MDVNEPMDAKEPMDVKEPVDATDVKKYLSSFLRIEAGTMGHWNAQNTE